MEERDLKEKSGVDLETNSDSVIAALNIALIISSLSSSHADQQRLNLEEMIEERESQGGRNSGSRSTRQQQVSGLSRPQQSSKVQAKIRVARYSRRL